MNDFLPGLTQPQPEAARAGEQASFPEPNLPRGSWFQRRKGLQLRVMRWGLQWSLAVLHLPAFPSLSGWQWGRSRPAGFTRSVSGSRLPPSKEAAVSSLQLHCLPGACPASRRGVMGGVTHLLYRIPELPQASAARPRSRRQGGSKMRAELLGSRKGRSGKILAAVSTGVPAQPPAPIPPQNILVLKYSLGSEKSFLGKSPVRWLLWEGFQSHLKAWAEQSVVAHTCHPIM